MASETSHSWHPKRVGEMLFFSTGHCYDTVGRHRRGAVSDQGASAGAVSES